MTFLVQSKGVFGRKRTKSICHQLKTEFIGDGLDCRIITSYLMQAAHLTKNGGAAAVLCTKRDFHRLKLVTDKFVQRKWEGGGGGVIWQNLLVGFVSEVHCGGRDLVFGRFHSFCFKQL